MSYFAVVGIDEEMIEIGEDEDGSVRPCYLGSTWQLSWTPINKNREFLDSNSICSSEKRMPSFRVTVKKLTRSYR